MKEEFKLSSLAIVGTSGLKEDAARLNRATYDRMVDTVRDFVEKLGIDALVSGGGPWAEHVAVRLALDGVIAPPRLTLVLPAAFRDGRFDDSSQAGDTADYQHRQFAKRLRIDPTAELDAAIRRGAKVTIPGSDERMAAIGKADALMALTFGTTPAWQMQVGDGGVRSVDAGVKAGSFAAQVYDAASVRLKVHIGLG